MSNSKIKPSPIISIMSISSLKFQNIQIKRIIRAFLSVYREVFLACPTPLMFANIAYHVWATSFFFYFYITIFAGTYIFSKGLCPIFIVFWNFLLTSFIKMWMMKTIETENFLASFTYYIIIANFNWWFLKISFTIWCRTTF